MWKFILLVGELKESLDQCECDNAVLSPQAFEVVGST